MFKKYVLMLMAATCLAGTLSAQMAMREMTVPQRPNRAKVKHVPASTWNAPSSANSAESAAPVSSLPEQFTMRLSPNPSQDRALLEFFLPAATRLSVTLTDREGRVLRNIFDGEVGQAGVWTQSVMLQGLSAGLYYVRVRKGGEYHSLPLIKL